MRRFLPFFIFLVCFACGVVNPITDDGSGISEKEFESLQNARSLPELTSEDSLRLSSVEYDVLLDIEPVRGAVSYQHYIDDAAFFGRSSE